MWSISKCMNGPSICTICPRSLDPFYAVTNYIKWVKPFRILIGFKGLCIRSTYCSSNSYTPTLTSLYAPPPIPIHSIYIRLLLLPWMPPPPFFSIYPPPFLRIHPSMMYALPLFQYGFHSFLHSGTLWFLALYWNTSSDDPDLQVYLTFTSFFLRIFHVTYIRC